MVFTINMLTSDEILTLLEILKKKVRYIVVIDSVSREDCDELDSNKLYGRTLKTLTTLMNLGGFSLIHEETFFNGLCTMKKRCLCN